MKAYLNALHEGLPKDSPTNRRNCLIGFKGSYTKSNNLVTNLAILI